MPVVITRTVLAEAKKAALAHGGGVEWHFTGIDECDLWLLEGVSMFSASLPGQLLGIAIKTTSAQKTILKCKDKEELPLIPSPPVRRGLDTPANGIERLSN